jgi:hypothetical protein
MNPGEHRYRAFISYSQRDREHAKRLHTALESYRVPKGVSAPLQPNRRLGRFFRDDDETGASGDLGATLREALEQSENLIVICSPNAARSKWVNAEIEHFKAAGAVEASCGEKEYRREQVAFGGDVRARLREILSDQSEAAP